MVELSFNSVSQLAKRPGTPTTSPSRTSIPLTPILPSSSSRLTFIGFVVSFGKVTNRFLTHQFFLNAAVKLLVNNHAQAIIGPQTLPEVAFIAELGTKAYIPILSFSATSSSDSPACFPFFVRTAPSGIVQAAAIAALAHAFNWPRIVLINEDDDYDASLIPSLVNALAFMDTAVPYHSAIPSAASDAQIAAELYYITTLQTYIFILHATSTIAPHLLSRASTAEMMIEGFVWIATIALTSTLDSLDPRITGILIVKPYIPR